MWVPEPRKEGFDAEWRMINLILLDGDLISRSEMFDEADLDAALARFEQAHAPGTAAGEHGEPGLGPLERLLLVR